MKNSHHLNLYTDSPAARGATKLAEGLGSEHDAAQSRTRQVFPGCLPVRAYDDILPDYRGTPIEELLAYHNLGASFQQHHTARLLVGMCMDYRMWLRVPPDFAYVLRVGGANLRGLDFHISMAVANGVTAVCVIGHDQCAMSGVVTRDQSFVSDLVEHGGWNNRDARNHFKAHVAHADIGDVTGFVQLEAVRLSRRYPRVIVAPLVYSVAERVLYQVEWSELK